MILRDFWNLPLYCKAVGVVKIKEEMKQAQQLTALVSRENEGDGMEAGRPVAAHWQKKTRRPKMHHTFSGVSKQPPNQMLLQGNPPNPFSWLTWHSCLKKHHSATSTKHTNLAISFTIEQVGRKIEQRERSIAIVVVKCFDFCSLVIRGWVFAEWRNQDKSEQFSSKKKCTIPHQFPFVASICQQNTLEIQHIPEILQWNFAISISICSLDQHFHILLGRKPNSIIIIIIKTESKVPLFPQNNKIWVPTILKIPGKLCRVSPQGEGVSNPLHRDWAVQVGARMLPDPPEERGSGTLWLETLCPQGSI